MNPAVLLFILSLTGDICARNTGNWSWSWNCVSGFCKKTQKTEETNPPIKWKSTLDICRLTCGQFGALWPKPTIETRLGEDLIPFNLDIPFEYNNAPEETRTYLKKISDIFLENLLKECGENCVALSSNTLSVSINVETPDLELTQATNEGYTLHIYTETDKEIRSAHVSIESPTVFGARHALETLSQLITSYTTENNSKGLLIITEATIEDKPVFKYRGLLIDTARNYMKVSSLKKQLDAMATSKLNVFHWHITDSQSFPLILPNNMKLSKYGAYSKNQTYTIQDVKDIKQYAKERGIRLVMEIDAPAHAGNGWQWGPKADLGNLAVCVNQQPWKDLCIQPPCGQLNPVNPNTYTVLRGIFEELVKVLDPQEYFHMGGDEVFIPCWNSSQEIVDAMKKMGLGTTSPDFMKLWALYQSQATNMLDVATSDLQIQDKKIILWSSHLTDPRTILEYLPKVSRTIIQTWVPASNNLNYELTSKGYEIIVSTKDAWYLDHGLGHGNNVYHTWRNMYANTILSNDKVLGGEACLWSEIVYDDTLDTRIWPRTAAVAERLWSDPSTNTAQAETRFYRHRRRLISRGIQAEAVTPGWCSQNEGECQ